MICARCCETTTTSPCEVCGVDPLLEGRYRLDELLAVTPRGRTFRGYHLADERPVAIKQRIVADAADAKALELVDREARVQAQLEHRGIPHHIESFRSGRGLHRAVYTVQELVGGRTLSAILPRHRFTESEVLRVVHRVLDVVVYLHELSPPVVHRNLHPDNVLLSWLGRVVVVGFGSVRDELEDVELGGTTFVGSLGYMAPEQFRGDAGVETDLYGVGALAVHLLTRREPRSLLDDAGRLQWRRHAKVHPRTAALLDALLEPKRGKRLASARIARRYVRRLRRVLHDAARSDAYQGRDLTREARPAVSSPRRRGSVAPLPVLARPRPVKERVREWVEPLVVPMLPVVHVAQTAARAGSRGVKRAAPYALAFTSGAAGMAVLVAVTVFLGGLIAVGPSVRLPELPSSPTADQRNEYVAENPGVDVSRSLVATRG